MKIKGFFGLKKRFGGLIWNYSKLCVVLQSIKEMAKDVEYKR